VLFRSPVGVKQALVTFGNYIIVFVAGLAYYRLNTQIAWTQIVNFNMSTSAPRYWTIAVPLSTTNYARLASPTVVGGTASSASLPITQLNTISGSFQNVPGLLVQDNVNQPQFIYIDNNGQVQCKVTQTYAQWLLTIDPSDGVTVLQDKREYVPIGNCMEWYNGILFIVSQDFATIYRSVSGRPLDFMVNVDVNGQPGGDATTTSYSVGVSGITAIRSMPGNMLFVSAGSSVCFSITLNQTPNAPTIFGEYTFNRTFLFNSNCISDRGIVDIAGSPNSSTSGDSVFIDSNGLRSFNAILQQQNEGRNSIFSATVQGLFHNIVQSSPNCSAINFDNYVIFSVLTTMGYRLVVYDAITDSYTAIDQDQVGNNAVKQFAAINIDTLSLYAITSDDRLVQLFGSNEQLTGTIRLGAVSTQDPKKEIKITNVRAIFTNITEDMQITCSIFTNNRFDAAITSKLGYSEPIEAYNGINIGDDIDTQTNAVVFPFPQANQGWKAFSVISWTGGASLAAVSISTQDATPMQPPMTQAVIQQT
jgi:hypothetical protein